MYFKFTPYLIVVLCMISFCHSCGNHVRSYSASKQYPTEHNSSYSQYQSSFLGSSVSIDEKVSKVYQSGSISILTTRKFENGIGNDLFGKLIISSNPSDMNNLKKVVDFHYSVKEKINQSLDQSIDGGYLDFNNVLLTKSFLVGEDALNEDQHIDDSYEKMDSIINVIYAINDYTQYKTKWKKDRVLYQRHLRRVLKAENRLVRLLEIPSFITFFLFNENTQNLKRDYGGYAKSIIGSEVRRFHERVSNEYQKRNAVFNSLLNSTIYHIAYLSGRESKNIKGEDESIIKASNIHEIQDFSKERIWIEWSDLDKTSSESIQKTNSYAMLKKWVPEFQKVSISRDAYYTLSQITENYFIISGFDTVF